MSILCFAHVGPILSELVHCERLTDSQLFLILSLLLLLLLLLLLKLMNG
jgi:hypothetical protein